jgi:DNA polymerase (family 10)
MKGSTKTSVLLHDTLRVDLRVVKKESFGAALQYFTGSKEHNVTMRGLAIKKGYKLNEYGLFDKKTEKYITGKNEEDIYKKLGLSYIEPELRENRGEIEEARKGKLPQLVGYDDIHGDFHVHSIWSDGSDSLGTLAQYTKKLGYSFFGSTDHSQSLKIANGLSEDRIDKKLDEIEKLNKKLSDFKILFGTECDIKSDGTLDYSNKILKKFHTGFKMDKDKMTKRIVRGMENEYVDFLAHPTGRLIGKRDPYEVDIEQIIDTAKERRVFLEINSFPDRLDLPDIYVKLAKEKGAKFVLGSDSHSFNNLTSMHFGIANARRGWLEKKDILNTYRLKDIEKSLGEKHE